MKKVTIFILMSVFTTLSIHGQTSTVTYENLFGKIRLKRSYTYMVTTDKISEDVYFVKRYLNNGELEPILFEELYVNAQGIKNGSYIKYESNGFKKQEGSYRNDKKEGIWTYYADQYPH